MYEGLPPALVAPIKQCVLPLLAHSQLSVREAAVQLCGTYLGRSGPAEVVDALDDLLGILSCDVPLASYATAAPSGVDRSGGSATVPSTSPLLIATGSSSASADGSGATLDAFAAEGVLSLLVVVLRLASPGDITDRWHALQPLVFRYLDHGASTVRQAASKALLQVVTTCGRGWSQGDATATTLVRCTCQLSMRAGDPRVSSLLSPTRAPLSCPSTPFSPVL